MADITTADAIGADALIIDTGCANINSLKFALERLGYHIVVSDDEHCIGQAKKLFLPGVGAASFAMQTIKDKQLTDIIATLEQPVLGICLGMQLLCRSSRENGINTRCLGLIDSDVDLLKAGRGHSGLNPLRLPHMGWNTLSDIGSNPLFNSISERDYFYFVHSYCAPISSRTLAQCHYGQAFSASLCENNFYGVQFHPERSGKSGATLLTNFMEYC
ncbi:imidazole glycerol phosphate synthase subunit HisH [Thalassotalea ponticola]|uniref:imidazole glycerol phosphate synthase subunit HisH n=1 Tax=Thalassotalea ponticola TaxID=1523392 RepID=UPI0025B32EBB|nr:imidazole glycerol phosphate synthase subunit HisH [Thalassotalea ponticola]MDN3651303.1 imidazole glycerol phosphate synthase subunit HisH [Thalassotalea ponticola]